MPAFLIFALCYSTFATLSTFLCRRGFRPYEGTKTTVGFYADDCDRAVHSWALFLLWFGAFSRLVFYQ